MIIEEYVNHLKSLSLVPEFLTKPQKENVSNEYIYQALQAKTLQFKEIEFLPQLSAEASDVLSELSRLPDRFGPKCKRYQNLYEIIHYADSGFSTVDILNKAKKMDDKQTLLFFVSLIMPVTGLVIYRFISERSHVDKKNSSQDLENILMLAAWLCVIFYLLTLFREYVIIHPMRWLYNNQTGLDARVLQPKENEISTYFKASQYSIDPVEEISTLTILLNKGVLTRAFIQHFDLSDEQFKNLNHPASAVMLTSNGYAVKLSHFLKVVGKISQQQAWVLANPVVYSSFNWHVPYNFSSRQKNLQSLLRDSKELNAVAIVKRNRRHVLLITMVYPIITFGTFPLYIKPTNKWPDLRAAIVLVAPFIAAGLVALLAKLASYLLPGNGLFKKKTVVENCVLVQSGQYKPESIDVLEMNEQILLMTAQPDLGSQREPLRRNWIEDNPGRTLGRIDISPHKDHYATRMTPPV